MQQVINIKDNITMMDQINMADATLPQVGVVSPAGPTAPSVNVISQDAKILFGDDTELEPTFPNKTLNLLKKRQIHERESTQVNGKLDLVGKENSNAAKCRKYRGNEVTKKLR